MSHNVTHVFQASTQKQKYQRILERKQAAHPDLLCSGYPGEFKDYLVHCAGLGFEDRPDYRYLRRIFKDLFERQGLEDDGVYDWDVIKRRQEDAAAVASGGTTAAPAPAPTPAPAPAPTSTPAPPPVAFSLHTGAGGGLPDSTKAVRHTQAVPAESPAAPGLISRLFSGQAK